MPDIYVDTETTGLNPFEDRVVLFQYRWQGEQDIMMIPNPTKAQMHRILSQADRIVMHNSPFDLGFIGYIPRPEQIVDTAKLSRIQDFEQEEHSLDKVALRTFGFDPYRGMDKKVLQKSDWSAKLTSEQVRYAEIDVKVLGPISARLSKTISSPIYQFDTRSIVAGLTIQQHGLPVLHDEVRAEAARVSEELSQWLAKLPVNPNSPKQVTQILGIESSSDKDLAVLEAAGVELARDIRHVRGLAKYLNFLEKLGAKDRYYGTLQPNAASGRFTSSKHNIQQIPRAQKKFIGSKVNVLISADYAQLELRSIAVLARDKTMVELFIAGEDMHAYTAQQLFGPSYTKTQRQIAKTFNFALLYGSGAKTVQAMLLAQSGLSLPVDEVSELKRKWLATYTGIAAWQKRGSTRYEFGTPWRTPMGRPYKANSYTQMLSLENQGLGAEVARYGLHYIVDTLDPRARAINFVHDSILIECPDDPSVYEPACQVVFDGFKKSWENAPLDTCGVPMPVTVAVAHDWKTADEAEDVIYKLEG